MFAAITRFMVRSTKITECLPGKSITIMMAAHGSATTMFETVVPSTPAHDTELSRSKGGPLGGGFENRCDLELFVILV